MIAPTRCRPSPSLSPPPRGAASSGLAALAALITALALPAGTVAQTPSSGAAPSSANVPTVPPRLILSQEVATPPAQTEAPLRIVLLLPTEQPLLRRAAASVRSGAMAAFALSKPEPSVRDCPYPNEGVVAAYERCVDATVDWVIGPLSRSDVAALAGARLALVRPTLMLSPLGATPPAPMAVLAPDLDSEAEAIARQAGDDACRKPIVLDTGGALAGRVATAMTLAWRERNAIGLPVVTLGARSAWRKLADGWRQDNVDCLLFSGGGATLAELRPYLRDIAIYATSASYEAPLERTVDWTGVRIADAPWLIDADRADFIAVAAPAPAPDAPAPSPTLARLYALGVDAARIALSAARGALPVEFDGAIGRLTLRDAQYRRVPMVGEFRERALVKAGS